MSRRAVGTCEGCGKRNSTVQLRDVVSANLHHRRVPLCGGCATARGVPQARFGRYSIAYKSCFQDDVNTGMDGRKNGDTDWGPRGPIIPGRQRVERISVPAGYNDQIAFAYWPPYRVRAGWITAATTSLYHEAQAGLSPVGWAPKDSCAVVAEVKEALQRWGERHDVDVPDLNLQAASFDTRDLGPDDLSAGSVSGAAVNEGSSSAARRTRGGEEATMRQAGRYRESALPPGIDLQCPHPDVGERLRDPDPTRREFVERALMAGLLRWHTPRAIPCPNCHALGRLSDGRRCWVCHGDGTAGRDLTLSAESKRTLVRAWIRLLPTASNRDIARIVGVGHAMVAARRAEAIDHPVKQAENPLVERERAADTRPIGSIMMVSGEPQKAPFGRTSLFQPDPFKKTRKEAA